MKKFGYKNMLEKLTKFVFAIGLPFAILSCGEDSGLGSSIDTEAPKISITYPPASAVIRESFVFGGGWSDDKVVNTITVSVAKVVDSKKTVVYTGDATVNEDKTWTITLNNYDSEKSAWEFIDGDYEISAVAKDGAGNKSGTASRGFSIDNTAPVLVLTKPTSYGANTPKSYGRTVQFEGTFSEACTAGISKLLVSFFDEKGNGLFDQEFTNISDMSNANPLVVAKFFDSDERDSLKGEDLAKWENYKKLYTAEQIDDYDAHRDDDQYRAEPKELFFTVKATDNAKIYRSFSLSGDFYEAIGNSTTSYYRGTTEMLTLINSKNAAFPDFTVLSLRKYLNHTDSTYSESEALQKIIDAAESVGTLAIDETSGVANSISESIANIETKDATENAQLVYLNFSANPQNNPTYTVGGLKIDKTQSDGENYKDGYAGYYSGSSIGVSISAGLDGTALETSTISVYYAEVNDDDTFGTKKLLWTYNEAAAITYARLIDPLLAGKSDEEVRAAITKSDSIAKAYRYSITASNASDDALSISTTLDTTTDNISVGKKYAFIIEGNDIDGQEIIKYDLAGYGFFVKVNSSVPVISVDDYDANAPLLNKTNLSSFTKSAFVGDKISFKGTIEASEDLRTATAYVMYTVTVTDTKSSGASDSVKGYLTESSGLVYQEGTSFTYDWEFTVDPSSAITNLCTNGSGLYSVDVVIEAKNPNDSSGKTGEKANVSRKYYLDDKASEFSAVSLAVEGTSDYSVYFDGNTYYLNNKTSTFKLSGNVTDNYRTGSTYYKINGYTTGGAAQEYVLPAEKFETNMQWEFSGISLSGFAPNDSKTDATLTIVSVDEAGNTVEEVLAIEFDTTPPVLLEDAEHPFTVVVQGVSKTTDAYFKDSTLPISGFYTEKGSGVASGYYWVKVPGGSTPATTDYTSAGLFSVTNNSSTGISSFEKQSVGSFAASTISGENSVHNTLYLGVKDNVGNVSAVTEKTIKLDTSAPSLSSKQSGQQYTNLEKDFTVSGTYTDNVSGVVSVALKMGSTTLETITFNEGEPKTKGTWSATIPAATLKSAFGTSTTGNINATVTDAAGNHGISTIFSLTVDEEPPTITITSPEADSTINSKIKMQGGATYDGAAPKTLTVYYFAGTTAPEDSTSLAENVIGSFSDASILTWSIENLDVQTLSKVTESEPSKTLYICTEVTDAAGNSKFEPKKYTVDQNKDRPIITFTSIDSAGSWLKSRTLSGTVTDDDGAVSSLKISVSYDGGNTWKVSDKTIEVSNGSWNYEFDSDNANIKVKFSVTDAAGTVFTTDSTSRFTRPYYKYNTTKDSDFASQQNHTFTDYGLDDDSGYSILVKVDTANPYYHTLGMDYGKEGTSLAAASTVAANASSYTVVASKYVGGDYKNVKFYVPVYDANGIASVTATVGAQNVTFTETTATVKSANTTYTYYESGVVDISTFTSGITNLVVTIKDIADNETEATASFTVDNTGPENIDIISPSSTESLTGDIDITGTVSDKGIGVITEIEWLIPTKEQYTYSKNAALPPDTTVLGWDGWSSDKNLKTKTVFDFVFTSDTDKDLVGFERKENENYVYGVYENGNDTFTVPVFFRATDSLGNKSVKTGWYLTHNPDGDRPVTELTYPIERDYEAGKQYVTLSGKIQVTGAAEIPSMTCNVEKTFIQIGKVTESDSTVNIDWSENNVKSAFATEIDGYEIVHLSDLTSKYVDGKNNTEETLHYASATGWWGLTATLKSTGSVSSSWTAIVNNKGGLDPTTTDTSGNAVPTKIALRACSINNNGKLGTWSEPVYIHVDNQAPVQSAEIRTYTDNASISAEYLADSANINTSKTYETNMYLRGKKYLAITITDNDGINKNSLIVKQNGVGTSTYYTTEVEEIGGTAGEKKMQLFIPMETTSLGTAVTYNVYITDNAEPAHTSSMTYSFKIDNDVPVITELTGNDEDLLASTPAAIVNSDYHYVLKSTVSDAGSGFEKLFFYFRRDTNVDTIGNRVLDPILKFKESSPGAGEYNYDTTAIEGASLDSYTVEGVSGITLYGKTIIGTLDEKRTTFTPESASDITNNKHIRDGGLIYIAGEYQLIEELNASTGTVTFANEIPTSIAVTSAGFPYGQVINTSDNSTWSGTSYSDGDTDGDKMPETVNLGASGTAWNLTAGLYSDNMTDGPVNLICIAFDIAGNISGKEIKTSIQNNAPRLAKLHLGTDLSGDGKYSDAAGEFNTYTFATTDTNDPKLVKKYETSVEFKTAASTYASYGKPFKVKEGLAVVPELTGGNGTIKMAWLANASSNAAVTKANATGFYAEDTSSAVTATFDVLEKTTKDGKEKDRTLAFVIPTAEFKNVADGTGKAMSFTFWDSTEGAVCGTDSSYCFVRVTDFTIALNDTVAPKTVIDPFYWEGLNKNSVYNSKNATSYSDLQGHIELEADLSSADKSALGSDPKVSGKVTFEGYAYDDQRLGSIWVAFEGFTLPSGSYLDSETIDGTTCYKAAQYNKATGTWTVATATMEANGWCFTLDSTGEKTYLSQDGHKVYYTFSVDTARISTVANTDVKAWVIACQDKSTLYTSKDKVATTGDETYNVPFYQMDVVPYIISVKTSLSEVDETAPTAFSRTALGHYPVYMTMAGNFNASSATRETVSLTGFNLTGGTVTFESGDSGSNTASLTSDLSFTLPTGAKSGKLKVTVNSIGTRNNTNNDDAHGKYDYTTDSSVSDTDVKNLAPISSGTMAVGTSGSNVIYKNYYNRQPNDANNNRLTDDVYLDVWQFNSSAVIPTDNSAKDIVMKVNPATYGGLLGFAFCDGAINFSMPKSTPTQYWSGSSYGEITYGGKDFFQCTAFAYDGNGLPYATAAPGESADNKGDVYYFCAGDKRFGVGFIAVGTYSNMAKDRFKSPSIAVNSDGSYAYLAYYDLLTGEIRFMGGEKNGDNGWGTIKSNYPVNDFTALKTLSEEQALLQVVANGSGDALGHSGEYVSIGIANNRVVMAWYDATNGNLMFAYSDANFSPTANNYKGINKNGWTLVNTPLLEGAGKYCQLAVANDNSIHIACYDSANGDLKYVYLKDYTASEKKTCTVDSYLSVGKELTIDVAKSGNYQIPYIGYYGATPKKPRYAYLASPATFYDGTVQDGATDDAYTGVWECTIVPSASTITLEATRRINVAVWKSSGVLANSATGPKYASQSTQGATLVYGNGTNNAALGYAVQYSSSQDYGETAQKR